MIEVSIYKIVSMLLIMSTKSPNNPRLVSGMYVYVLIFLM